MAQVFGDSGAWTFIYDEMKQIGFQPEELSDIENFLNKEKAKLTSEDELEVQLLQKESLRFSKQMARLDKKYQSAISVSKEKFSSQIEMSDLKIKRLQEPTTFFKKILRKWQIAKEKRNKKGIHKRNIVFFKQLEQKKNSLQVKLERVHQKNQFQIKSKVKNTKRNIEFLEKVQTSPEYFGAMAERKLIKNLSSLPDEFYVFNDIHLALKKAMRFDEKWRRSAQIDTLVISPAGIFVVEVKNWSKTFTAANDYHNPYDQVKWAAYLCYKQTQTKTREIIAHTGHIPQKPQKSRAKVLHLNEVKNYILWFKDRLLTKDQIEALAIEINTLSDRSPFLNW